ncbi:MAG: hypothetical protein R3A51_09230 [Nannocystaceae bacterium]
MFTALLTACIVAAPAASAPVAVDVSVGAGVAQRGLTRLADPMTPRASPRPAAALDLAMTTAGQIADRPETWLYGHLAYATSLGMVAREQLIGGALRAASGRTQRAAIQLGARFEPTRLRGRFAPGLALGYSLRPWTSDRALVTPWSLHHGPSVLIPLLARLPAARLAVRFTPELGLLARHGGLSGAQVRRIGVLIAGELAVEVRLHRRVAVGVAYREAHGLFDAVDPRLVLDHERFVIARVTFTAGLPAQKDRTP